MKRVHQVSLLILAACLCGSLCVAPPRRAAAQEAQVSSRATLERSYRTGYSDGYQIGYRDSVDKAPAIYDGKPEFQRADRGFKPAYGALADYRDGYQQGFEKGYGAGYERQKFNSAVSPTLARRGAGVVKEPAVVNAANDNLGATTDNNGAETTAAVALVNFDSEIPLNTQMRVELLDGISTKRSQRNDGFQLRVMEPRELEGSIVEGHLTRVRRPGRVRGRAEIQLTFDRIRLPNGKIGNFDGELTEIVTPSEAHASGVDSEGGIRGVGDAKSDAGKVGAATGVGAVVGAIAGGAKGFAIGALIGAGAGVTGVLSTRGDDIAMSRGQQMKLTNTITVRF